MKPSGRAVSGRTLAVLSPPTSIFPTRRRLVLCYDAAGYLNLSANAYMMTEFFNVTGIYDPDYSNFTRNTSVGAFSYFMGLSQGQYANYLVHSCRVRIVFTPVTTATMNLCVSTTDYLGVGSDYVSSSTGTATQVSQRKMSKLLTMSNTTDNGDPQTVEFIVYPWQVLGVTRSQYLTDRTFWGGYAANPINTGAFVALSISDALENGTNSSESVQYTVQLSFDVEVFGLSYV